jgi:hypothetical protein
MYCSAAKYLAIVLYLPPVLTIFEVLEGPILWGNELDTSNKLQLMAPFLRMFTYRILIISIYYTLIYSDN